MSINFTPYKLSQQTLENTSKHTKLTQQELTCLSLKDCHQLMLERKVIKKANPIKEFCSKIYQKFGEKYGLIKREINIYTDVD